MKLRAILVAFLLMLAASVPAYAQGQPVAPGWKIYTYAPSGNALKSAQADAVSDGLAGFTFLSTTDDALLATERPQGPHASIYGKTITATIKIDSGGGTFTSYGQGTSANPCGTPASVRLYFNTNAAFGFGNGNTDWYAHYWWSNPVASYVLADGTATLVAVVTPEHWSDWGGEPGVTVAEKFQLAAENPDLIGFSFGGGCFFENGVGVTGGTATFTLLSFDISD